MLGFGLAGVALADQDVDFGRDIRPILAARCFGCHGTDKQESGLQLDVADGLLEGGNSGPAIVPGNANESLLVEAISGGGDRISKMPPKGPALDVMQVNSVKRWIDAGAKMPKAIARRDNNQSSHWAFQPIANPVPPAANHWVRNAIDCFVLAGIESAGMTPSTEADRATLIRRVSLDLTGLPPSLNQVEAFIADSSDDAYEQLVDRLLASPHYGECWGRHWLDVARYADSNGYTIDGSRTIWKYRDWVINALNKDLPFDQFTIEQLAGDLLPDARSDQIIATGFHRNTLTNEEGGTDPEQFRVEAVVDRVSTTGAAFLGLTLGCARCHDHKYDPVSQREFYQLFAIFNNADEPSLSIPTQQQAKEMPALDAEIAQAEQRLAQVDMNSAGRQTAWEAAQDSTAKNGAGLSPAVREALAVPVQSRSPEQYDLVRREFQKVDPERVPLADRIAELKKSKKQLAAAITTTLVMRERPQPRDTHIHLRGDFLRPGAEVSPGVPSVLPRLATRGIRADRLDFARWLVAPVNPLTARVTVNRVWQAYFGRGLVATENDFGLQGDRPSHPALLDWLARRLMDRGWSLKSLHRLIVTSATYRQSSHARDGTLGDPYNRLVSRQARLRLEAESIRDAALATSGMLSDELGGPGVYPPQPSGIYRFTQQVKYWGESKGTDRYRRGIYTYFWRSSPYPFLKTFDAPDAVVACTRRPRSNTPLQALTMANDLALFEIAQGFAAKLMVENRESITDRVRYAFRCALARDPSPGEMAMLVDYLHAEQVRFSGEPQEAERVAPLAYQDSSSRAEAAACTMLARVLFNLDEFITRE